MSSKSVWVCAAAPIHARELGNVGREGDADWHILHPRLSYRFNFPPFHLKLVSRAHPFIRSYYSILFWTKVHVLFNTFPLFNPISASCASPLRGIKADPDTLLPSVSLQASDARIPPGLTPFLHQQKVEIHNIDNTWSPGVEGCKKGLSMRRTSQARVC